VVQIGLETIIAEDPDIIITSQSTTWPTQSRRALLDDDTLKDVSAIKNQKVFDIDGDMVDRPGPRMVDGLEEMNGHVEDFVNA
jgi:iron complex transport system substrate-binding protein